MIIMKYLKIPLDRVAVLIGKKGSIKKFIESKTGVELDINSKEGDVKIIDNDKVDPLSLLKVENIIKAIGRGFSPENAFMLFNEEMDFFVFNVQDYVGKRSSHIKRLKGRVIGKEGKTKRVIEELTDSKIVVYRTNISIISSDIHMNIVKKAVDMILTGTKQPSVYKFLEKQMKELKKQDYGF